MPWLQLVRIECHETEDWAGRDEVYIRVWPDLKDGWDRVWGPWSMNDGDKETLESDVAPREFIERCGVDALDQDQGGIDFDDLLGDATVRSSDADKGDRDLNFRDDDAQYTITYRVTSAKPEWP
jgi:hypothetical protein